MAVADKIDVNSFLNKTLPVFTPDGVQKMSDSLTSLENVFNVIRTSVLNVTNITTAQARSQRIASREIASETRVVPRFETQIDGASESLNVQPFKVLTEALDVLNKELSKLDLSPKGMAAGPQQNAGGQQEIDVDVDTHRKGKRGSKVSKILQAMKLPRMVTSRVGKISRVLSMGVSRALSSPIVSGAAAAVASNVTKSLIGITLGSIAGANLLRRALSPSGFMPGSGDFGGGGASGSWDGATPVEFDGDVNKILATIRKVESGGDYSTPKPKGMVGTASGAYSFIDTTWKSLTKKYGIGAEYSKAYQAPPQIQDAVAGKYVQEILKNVNNDVSRVPVVWYTGNYKGQLSSEAKATNKGLAVTSYQQKWLGTYASLGGKVGGQAQTGTADTSTRGTGTITSGFGMRKHPVTGEMRMHEGVDIAAVKGTPVFAINGGTIITAGDVRGYGNYVKIQHPEGDVTAYAHLHSIDVSTGQKIGKAQRIGTVGNTGVGTGDHLHFEFYDDGKLVDSRALYNSNKWIVGGAVQPGEQAPSPIAAPRTIPPTSPRVGISSPAALKAGGGSGGKSGTNFTGSGMFRDVQTR